MASNQRTLVHIGYHKTGTTWLQRDYFQDHPDVAMPLTLREVHQEFLYKGELRFDRDAFWTRFGSRFEQIWDEGKIAVISQEDLSGRPLTGDFGRAVVAGHLHEVLPHASVLIGIREQISMLASMYAQTVKEGYTGTLRRFLRGDAHEWGPPRAVEHVDYWALVSRYVDLFDGRVHLYLHEELRRAPRETADRLMVEAGFPASPARADTPRRQNVGLSRFSVGLLRSLNPFVRGWSETSVPLLPILPWKKVKNATYLIDRLLRLRPMSSHLRTHAKIGEIVGDAFSAGNRALEDAFGIDLQRYGYT